MKKVKYFIILVILWLPFFALGFYGQPFLDDYWNGSMARDMGFFDAYIHLFNNWSGRFFTNFLLIYLNPLSYDFLSGIKFVFIFSFILKISSVAYCLSCVTSKHKSLLFNYTLASVFILFYYIISPDKYAAMYSFTYFSVYQFPCLILILTPVFLYKHHLNLTTKSGAKNLIISGILCILGAGSNELTFMLLGWIIINAMLHYIIQRDNDKLKFMLFLGILLAFSGFIAIVAAPGNSNRLSNEFSNSFSYSPIIILERTIKFVIYLFSQYTTILILIFPIFVFSLGKNIFVKLDYLNKVPIWYQLFFVFFGIVLGSLPYHISGYAAIERSVNMIYWWLIFSWTFVCWNNLGHIVNDSKSVYSKLSYILIFAYVTYIETRAYAEWIIEAPIYLSQYNIRYKEVAKAKLNINKEVILKPIIGVTPRYVLIRDEVGENSLYDLQSKSSAWNNVRFAEWFGIDSVKVVPIKKEQ
ncbi:hypothetical protein FY528_16205 [Hymenobacter lutimineralis]|uniref:YfhO family protein n=1 Tax=Hymenobacter lutimineralis TaxID=2606448 RepID=A0A5D6UX88_9BACT|nr:DUF6056 family protein [Hymenobacter lutimineralis]TYZ07049.1 hypothetical protein FY528_16205 [Hymenobacter lutimineralis]